MNRATELEIMRLLHGELPEERARELRARIAREPELAAASARLERSWTGLELPPPPTAPPGFAQSVLARARRQGSNRGDLSWAAAPSWARAGAALALAAGLTLGAGAGRLLGGRLDLPEHPRPAAEEAAPAATPTAPVIPAMPATPAAPADVPAPAAPATPAAPADIAAEPLESAGEPSLAESYWNDLDDQSGEPL
jgi:anti-sigma factor RsiW